MIATNSWCWWDKSTHRLLSQEAAVRYFDLLDPTFLKTPLELGGQKKLAGIWLQDGSQLEDAGEWYQYSLGIVRSFNHFHDPTKPLASAGLTDVPASLYGKSTVLWAQDGATQTTKVGGDWSWKMVRDYQYGYLIALSKTDEEANLARTLMGLGYQMHLLHDMSQPNHVRNDTHMFDGSGTTRLTNGFETWVKIIDQNVNLILSSEDAKLIINSVSVDLTPAYDGGLVPVARLFDTRDTPFALLRPSLSFSQGLAEYTNTNYFSEDTMFASQRFDVTDKHFFAYPGKAETDIQKFIDNNLPAIPFFDTNKTYLNFRISKPANQTTGEPLDCLAKPGPNTAKYFKLLGEGKFFYDSFVQDNECFSEQARKLLPRAVGYSKAMLEYFYRGKIEVLPVTFNSTLKHIWVKLKNTTTTGEEMSGGEISLAIKYRLRSESADHVISPPATSSDYHYKVVKLSGQYGIPRDQQSEQVFDLGNDPLPLFATDVTLQVVYRGQLGNEAGSVAVGTAILDRYTSDIALSLPASSVYASAASSAGGFSRISVNANSLTDLAQPDGIIEMVLKYRLSSDPFRNVDVTTQPADPNAFYVIRANETNGVNTLQKGVTKELVFDISATPLPIWASDVYLDVVYRSSGTPDEKPLAIGQLDLAEPTPVDVFNNTDKVCINQQWYNSGSNEAIAAVGTDSYGNPLGDVFPHSISNIYFKAGPANSSTLTATPADNNLSLSTAVAPGHMQRLGYILTDYQFGYTADELVTDLDIRDDWTFSFENTILPGTGFPNQYDKGLGGMYSIRGQKIWSGAGLIYDNENFPADSPDCTWDVLQ